MKKSILVKVFDKEIRNGVIWVKSVDMCMSLVGLGLGGMSF